MSLNWIGKCLSQPSTRGKARIVHVDMASDTVFIVPFPKEKTNGRLDNYVPSPKVLSVAALQKTLDANHLVQLVDFDAPEHWLWSSAQLSGQISDGSGLRHRRQLASWVTKADEGYALIRPLVEGRSLGDILFDPQRPSFPADRAQELKKRKVAVRRALNAYLLGMGNKRALLPWYINSGAPGKEKFSKKEAGRPTIAAIKLGCKRFRPTTSSAMRTVLAMGWRRHMKKGVSVAVALERTRIDYMTKSISINGKKVTLKTEANDITTGIFRYWGTKDPASLRPKGILAGESVARNELFRRLNQVKGRYETLNGLAYIDSTSTDQTLTSSIHPLKVLKSPWRTEVLGAAIDYIFGVYVGFEPVSATTALLAILNAATDKVALCARFGHTIEPRDWLSCTFNTFAADNGEGKGQLAMQTLEQLSQTASYGKAYDAINKAQGESGHHQRQKRIDHLTPASTMGRRKQRGEADRALSAGLKFDDYMHLLIKEILHHNNKAYIDLPRLEMYKGLKEKTRRGVVEWMMEHHYLSSSSVDLTVLRAACLPRFLGVMRGNGIHVFAPGTGSARLIPDLVYLNDYLIQTKKLDIARKKSYQLEVHMDPSDLSQIWANVDGFKRFELASNDRDLKDTCLLDWLAITEDNKLAKYLAQRLEAAHLNDKLTEIDRRQKAGLKRRKDAIEAHGKPTKKSMRSDIRESTANEVALQTGIPPSHLPLFNGTGVKVDAPPVQQQDTDEQWLDIAASLYQSNQEK